MSKVPQNDAETWRKRLNNLFDDREQGSAFSHDYRSDVADIGGLSKDNMERIVSEDDFTILSNKLTKLYDAEKEMNKTCVELKTNMDKAKISSPLKESWIADFKIWKKKMKSSLTASRLKEIAQMLDGKIGENKVLFTSFNEHDEELRSAKIFYNRAVWNLKKDIFGKMNDKSKKTIEDAIDQCKADCDVLLKPLKAMIGVVESIVENREDCIQILIGRMDNFESEPKKLVKPPLWKVPLIYIGRKLGF